MTVLITGGAGYIGSHICVSFMAAGRKVVVFDNFSNSSAEVPQMIGTIAGCEPTVVVGDVRDRQLLVTALLANECTAVVHCAGLKAVANSVSAPLEYYDCNVVGTIELLQAMTEAKINRLVFSSSATVYGVPQYLPIDEDHRVLPINPYGWSKLMAEQILRDQTLAYPDFHVAILRYFNPVGCHRTGLIGENPRGTPNNLMPFIAHVASKLRPFVTVFGDDYNTPDGTGVRDFVHVMDVAEGHLKALDEIASRRCLVLNLGTGTGHSVKELLKEFSSVCGFEIPYVFAGRRAGDVASSYAEVERAHAEIGWKSVRGLREMCEDVWRWQCSNSRSDVSRSAT